MFVTFKSGEIYDCAYAESLNDGSMFLTLKDKSFMEAAQILGSVDLSSFSISRMAMDGEKQVRTYEGYTTIEFITTEGTNARAKLRRAA